MKRLTDGVSSVKISDRSKINDKTVQIYGVQPSMFDSTMSEFLKIEYNNKSTGLSLAEQLYTARGT